MRQLIVARARAIADVVRLGADAAHAGDVVIKQGIGGKRIEQYLGRRINPSGDEAYDFLDGATKIQLKGPFINPDTLEPLANPNVPGLAQGISNYLSQASGFDKLFIDTLGLTDNQAILLKQLVVNAGTKVVIFLR